VGAISAAINAIVASAVTRAHADELAPFATRAEMLTAPRPRFTPDRSIRTSWSPGKWRNLWTST